MDSDRVLVMDSGTVVVRKFFSLSQNTELTFFMTVMSVLSQEFDHPHELLKKPNGYFYQMVQNTGAATAEQLQRIAQKVRHQNFKKLNLVLTR